MGHGVYRYYAATMASADSLVSFDLGRTYQNVYLQIPTMASYTNLQMEAAITSGGTYYQVRLDPGAPVRNVTASMASADTLVSFNLDKVYPNLNLMIPTMASVASFTMEAATSAGGTYYQVRLQGTALSANAAPLFQIPATAAAGGGLVPIPGGYQFIRLRADSAPTAMLTFTVMPNDNSVSGVVANQTFVIAASAAANGGIVKVPPGFQAFQFRATDSAPTAATTFRVLCGD